jgi:hypothetical protein
MGKSNTLLDRLNARIKNNPVLAIVIVLGTLVIALSSFTDAARNLLQLISTEPRPDINGEWKSEVTYDWQDARYTETFSFRGEGKTLFGTASFLEINRGILSGIVEHNSIQFATEYREVLDDWNNPRTVTHHYKGRIFEDSIQFVMQTVGGFTEHVPVEFTARRVTDN